MFIEANQGLMFQYNKKTKDIITVDTTNMTKLIQNTVGLKRSVEHNVTYPYGYEGQKYH